MPRKIWFFGDSFVSANEGWLNCFSERLDCEIANLGEVGSSIDYLQLQLETFDKDIAPDDVVVVCYTGAAREYFAKSHFTTIKNMREQTPHSIDWAHTVTDNIKEKLWNLYKQYVLYFADYEVIYLRWLAVVSHIQKNILPNLATKNVVEYYGFDERNAYAGTTNPHLRSKYSKYVKQDLLVLYNWIDKKSKEVGLEFDSFRDAHQLHMGVPNSEIDLHPLFIEDQWHVFEKFSVT